MLHFDVVLRLDSESLFAREETFLTVLLDPVDSRDDKDHLGFLELMAFLALLGLKDHQAHKVAPAYLV